jgi:hypothetical protein
MGFLPLADENTAGTAVLLAGFLKEGGYIKSSRTHVLGGHTQNCSSGKNLYQY